MSNNNEGEPMKFTGAPDHMTLVERSCLLRAARERVRQLHEMAESYHMSHNVRELELVLGEINCLNAAMAWIWRQFLLS